MLMSEQSVKIILPLGKEDSPVIKLAKSNSVAQPNKDMIVLSKSSPLQQTDVPPCIDNNISTQNQSQMLEARGASTSLIGQCNQQTQPENYLSSMKIENEHPSTSLKPKAD